MSYNIKSINYYQAQSRLDFLPNYFVWMGSKIDISNCHTILDIGAGKGHIYDHLDISDKLLFFVDMNKDNIDYLKTKFKSHSVTAIQMEVSESNIVRLIQQVQPDCIIMLDVLEHIKMDQQFMINLTKALSSACQIIIKVPNSPFLYSSSDKASGHYRRYSKKEFLRLVNLLNHKQILHLSIAYFNLLGGIIYYLKCRIKTNATFSGTFSPYSLKLANTFMPLFRFIDSLNPFPFGLSLICHLSVKPNEK